MGPIGALRLHSPQRMHNTSYKLQLLQNKHLAPYVGECKVNDTTYLVWEASGEENMLEDYIDMDNGWVQLAKDLELGSSNDFVVDEERKETISKQQRQNLHSELAAEVLPQIRRGWHIVIHAELFIGIERDIKVWWIIFWSLLLTIICDQTYLYCTSFDSV